MNLKNTVNSTWDRVEASYPTIRNAVVMGVLLLILVGQMAIFHEIAVLQGWTSGQLGDLLRSYQPFVFSLIVVMIVGLAIWLINEGEKYV